MSESLLDISLFCLKDSKDVRSEQLHTSVVMGVIVKKERDVYTEVNISFFLKNTTTQNHG
jgi:hypothetical protein